MARCSRNLLKVSLLSCSFLPGTDSAFGLEHKGGGSLFAPVSNLSKTLFSHDGTGFDVQFGPNAESTARPGGEQQFDAIRSMVTNGPGRNGVGQVSGVAGTVRGLVNNQLAGNNGYSVGVFGNATCEVDGCVSWGSNFSVADNGPDRSKHDASKRTIEGQEVDVNVFNATSVAEGVNVVGNFLTPATSPTFGYNLQVNGQSPSWAQGYSTGAGAAVAAFVAGASKVQGRNVPSQPVVFNYFDGSDRHQSLELKAALGPQGAVLAASGGVGFAAERFFETPMTPASRSPCEPGQFGDDKDFHYVCVARNRWRRVALSDY